MRERETGEKEKSGGTEEVGRREGELEKEKA